MGKKIKIISDSSLAKSHEAGAAVELTQPVLHDQLGLIYCLVPKLYSYHLSRASRAFKKLEALQEKIVELPIHADNARMISDFEFMRDIYDAGFDLTVHIYLSFDYFLQYILMDVYNDSRRLALFERRNTIGKLKHILEKVISRKELVASVGYSKLAEIELIRNAFNHPSAKNVYNANEGKWDEVPLAWIISRKYKEAYKEVIKLFEELNNIWVIEKKKYERPGTVAHLQRGIKSLHQIKKSIKH